MTAATRETSSGRFSAAPSARGAARAGLTLLELLVVLVILAVAATIAVVNIEPLQDQARFEQTQRSLNEIESAVGPDRLLDADGRTPMAVGYVADMGRLPRRQGTDPLTQLSELWDQGTQPAFALRAAPAPDADVLLPSGWRGPYLRLPIGTAEVRDGWGAAFALTFDGTDVLTGVRSRGGDNADGGTDEYAQDRSVAFDPAVYSTTVAGYVAGARAAGTYTIGTRTETVGAPVAKVFLYDSLTNAVTTTTVAPVAPGFAFSFAGVPVGNRVLRAEQIVDVTESSITRRQTWRSTRTVHVPKGGTGVVELRLELVAEVVVP